MKAESPGKTPATTSAAAEATTTRSLVEKGRALKVRLIKQPRRSSEEALKSLET